MAASDTRPMPIQPVASPILCNPYEEPADHWLYRRESGEAYRAGFRRPAAYWYKTERVGTSQTQMFPDEDQDLLELVNRLRSDVRRWREADYRGATTVTKDLLRHWSREKGTAKGGFRRLFFCQREAVETLIYLAEIRLPESARSTPGQPSRSRTGFGNFEVTDEHLRRLCKGEDPRFGTESAEFFPTLLDQPADESLLGLRRLGCKMATGSGKTVVMAMLITWALCNRGVNPHSEHFPDVVLVCCPNLTVKERLQVLRPGHEKNYYDDFGMVPAKYRDFLNRGTVIVENWHQFQPASPHSEGGKTSVVVDKGEEDPASFARRILGDSATSRMPIMVFNDEGHHCWRPNPNPVKGLRKKDGEERVATEGDLKTEKEEARVWLDGLDRLNNCGMRGAGVPCVGLCVDLSATPFYIQGSDYPEGLPFPWLVSDFGLVDAIESGIVKIPRLPVQDTTGRPDPKYFRLWKDHIVADLQPGQKLPGKQGKPKPNVVYEKAEAALQQLAGEWRTRFDLVQSAEQGQERVPPVLIIVCDNTDIAEEFYRRISGETTEDVVTPEDVEQELDAVEDDEEEVRPKRGKKASKPKTRTVYGQGEVQTDALSNTAHRKYTIRIDSKLLAEAESGLPGKSKNDAAQALRKVVATVGKKGEPGEHLRCVVSVSMLTEGWDASNVTHILGVRAFGSQLLCEQVVGRGLRRMNYRPDPTTGLLPPEHVDVYGIPFSVIPYKGKATGSPADDDRPLNHVRAMDERSAFRMQFPVVEGYVYALRQNLIRCDIDSMEVLELEPHREPTATFVRVAAGVSEGPSTVTAGAFETVKQDRAKYHEANHIQTIAFEFTRRVIDRLLSGTSAGAESERKARVMKLQSRHMLFPQVYRYVDEYLSRKVNYRDEPKAEIALQRYAQQVVERLAAAIEPDDGQGESPLLPVLNKTKPLGSTDDIDFTTKRGVHGTTFSHVNQVVLDTQAWESSAAFRLEEAARAGTIDFYARTDGLEFSIPYDHMNVEHGFEPDFLVRMSDGTTLVLEVKGYETTQDTAKYDAARQWVRAVNNWGKLGRWDFHPCRDPQTLGRELVSVLKRNQQ